MQQFRVKEQAHEWAARFGGTDGCEERAYLSAAKAALEYALSLCSSGASLGSIRLALYNKAREIDGREKA